MSREKQLIEDYFKTIFTDNDGGMDQYIIESITKATLLDNIETLITREKNLHKRLKDLEAISLIYKDDTERAYKDAYQKALVEIRDNMTLNHAIDKVSRMSLDEIIEFKRQYD